MAGPVTPSLPVDAALIDRLENLRNAATPGPWISDSHEIYQAIPGLPDISGDWLGETCRIEGDPHHATSDADAELIVALVNAAPSLLSAARRATALDTAVRELAEELEAAAAESQQRVAATVWLNEYESAVAHSLDAVAARLRNLPTRVTADEGTPQ